MLADNWGWGAGPESFKGLYPWYQTAGFTADHAHQWYLQFWLEYGLLSLIVFGRFIKKIMVKSVQEPYNQAILILIAAFLTFGLVESWSEHLFLGGYFWLLVGILISLQMEETVYG